MIFSVFTYIFSLFPAKSVYLQKVIMRACSATVNRLAALLAISVWMSLASAFQAAPQNAGPEGNRDWKKKYHSVSEFGEVYVVKSIYSFCDEYDTWLADKNGKLLTPAYRDIGPFSDGRAEFVPKEGHNGLRGFHGYIDKRGKVVIPPVYHGAGEFSNGRAWVIYPVDSLYGLSVIDTMGKELHRLPVEPFSESFRINRSTSVYACNRDCVEMLLWWDDGKLVMLYSELSAYTTRRIAESGGGAYVLNYSGKFGYIDREHVLKTPVVLDSVDFSGKYSFGRLQRILYKGRYGFADRESGEVAIACQYEDTKPQKKGLLWVKKDGKWGCIDSADRQRIPFRFDYSGGFADNGLAAVLVDGNFGHVDTTGRFITPPVYDQVFYFNKGLAMVKKGNKYGYVDASGKLLVPLKFDKASPVEGEFARAERMGMTYLIGEGGSVRLTGLTGAGTAVLIILLAVLCISGRPRRIRVRRPGLIL